MTEGERIFEAAQRAAGFVAARWRRDLDGAEELLASFGSDTERVLAFALLAEAAVGQEAHNTGRSVDDCLRELSLTLALARESQAHDETPKQP